MKHEGEGTRNVGTNARGKRVASSDVAWWKDLSRARAGHDPQSHGDNKSAIPNRLKMMARRLPCGVSTRRDIHGAVAPTSLANPRRECPQRRHLSVGHEHRNTMRRREVETSHSSDSRRRRSDGETRGIQPI